jgi:hypothetical protein
MRYRRYRRSEGRGEKRGGGGDKKKGKSIFGYPHQSP